MTDAAGVPLTLFVTPANVPDGKVLLGLVDSLPAIQGPRGRPKTRPNFLLGDRGYGWEENIRGVKERNIVPVLARPSDKEHGSGLGVARWVVERTLAWFNNFRRLRLCYERSAAAFVAFHQLAAVSIIVHKLNETDLS